jgi:hypothetical protein
MGAYADHDYAAQDSSAQVACGTLSRAYAGHHYAAQDSSAQVACGTLSRAYADHDYAVQDSSAQVACGTPSRAYAHASAYSGTLEDWTLFITTPLEHSNAGVHSSTLADAI